MSCWYLYVLSPLVIRCLVKHCNLLGGFIFGYPNRIHHRVLQTHAAEPAANYR